MTLSSANSGYAARAVAVLKNNNWSLATAESLTAGGLAAAITEVPGSSQIYRGGIVAYDVEVKEQLLNVPSDLLATAGPVDPDVAAHMARGAKLAVGSDVGIATTGVAGPDSHGGFPPGRVYIGWTGPEAQGVVEMNLSGDREQVRRATVEISLQIITHCLHAVHIDLSRIECEQPIRVVRGTAE